jgi:hypothetical protein
VPALFVGRQKLKILLMVLDVLEDLLLLVAAGDDVVEGAGELDARLAGHGGMIANAGQGVNNYRFMSDPMRSKRAFQLVRKALLHYLDALAQKNVAAG